MKSEPMDPCKVLGVSRTASLQEIKKAYRIKARKHHPDHGGDAWAFEQTNEAYKYLLNPTASSSTAKKPKKPKKPRSKKQKPRPKKPDVAPGDQTPSGQPNQPNGWNQTSQPPPFAKAVPQQDQAQQPPQSTPPDLGWNAPNHGSDGAFDFGATEDDFQRRQNRRKKNSILPTLIGSLVGGLSAILCAGWILSIVNPAALHEFRDVPLIGKFLLGADEIDPAPKPLLFDPTVSVPTKEAEPEAGEPSVVPLDLRILNDAAIKMVDGSPVLKATFSIKNRSDKAISNYTGGYRLISKSRTHAYIQGDFKEKIPGGIEPGETLNFTLKILPNKSQRKIKTWSEGSLWEIWLDRAWANKKGCPVPKAPKAMKQVGF